LNEVIAAFVQDKPTIERGLFDEELVPEELTQVRMGKIIKDKYPELDAEDQEAVRQHAIAALNLTQQAKQLVTEGESDGSPNTALIDGVRRFAMDVRELDIDLIDRINPFGEAYAILAKTMSEDSLKQVAAAISAKRTSLTPDEAKEIAVRAVQFKKERGRCPRSIRRMRGSDAWPKARPPSCVSRRRDAMSDSDLDDLAAELAEFARLRRKMDAQPARSVSSLASRKSSASQSSTGVRRSMAKTATYSSAYMPCGSTACARSRIAAPCLSRWTIRACLLGHRPLPLRRTKLSTSTTWLPNWRMLPARTTSRSCAMSVPAPKSAPPRRSRIASPARTSRPSGPCSSACKRKSKPVCASPSPSKRAAVRLKSGTFSFSTALLSTSPRSASR
jgi:hypothetical protein